MFSPQLLNHFDALKAHFQIPETLPKVEGRQTTHYLRWTFIMITAPMRIIAFIFLKAMAGLLRCFSLVTLPRMLAMFSFHLMQDIDDLLTLRSYGSRLLVHARNMPQFSTYDVYTQRSVLKKDILSRELRMSIFNHLNFERIGFYPGNLGVCRGAVYWFHAVFLHMREKGFSFQEAAISAASQFTRGGPSQAVLLQSLGGAESLLLDLVIKKEQMLYHTPIKSLANGIYLVGLNGHCFSYLQEGGETYIFDPNKGLIEIEDPQQLKEEMFHYNKGKPEEMFFCAHTLANYEEIDESAS